jgi:hypothetical protein
MREAFNREGAESSHDAESKTPEYFYDDGLDKCIDLIRERLAERPYVVVSFEGSGTQIGKSQLARDLMNRLMGEGVAVFVDHDVRGFTAKAKSDKASDEGKIVRGQPWPPEKAVFIFDQTVINHDSYDKEGRKKVRRRYEDEARQQLGEIGITTDGVDLWIGIDRPDRPFEYWKDGKMLADIIIHNEKARDRGNANE